MYAGLILHTAGTPITEDSISNVLVAAGVEPDLRRIQALAVALKHVDISEAIKPRLVVPEPPLVEGLKKVEDEIDDGGLSKLFEPVRKEDDETPLSRLFG